MSHWAEVDENNIVLRVLVCDNNDPNGDEGYQFLLDTFGGRWVQTSYNNNFRGHFAGIGMIYNEEYDAFIGQQPYPSWSIDPLLKDWSAPTPMPEAGNFYWDEQSLSWVESIAMTGRESV